MSLHPNALPIDDAHMHLLTTINGLRLQLDARDETIRELREQIKLQAADLRYLYNEKTIGIEMTKYVTIDGKETTVDDLNRGIWYGAGNCTYWTDDWTKVSTRGNGIPCCPQCGSVGMQTTARDWFGGAERFQSEGNPGYVNFIKDSQEQCKRPMGFMEWFRAWIKENPTGRRLPNPRSGG